MISIRKAGIEDMTHVHDMAEIAFRHTYRDILSAEQIDYMMEWMYSPSNLRKQLDEGHVYFIAFRNGAPCGYVSIQPEEPVTDSRKLFHLQKIYVLPEEQSAGVGRLLYNAIIAHINEVSSGQPASIELNVNRKNPAIGFYLHLGFKILRQGDFHIGNGFYMNDYIMGIDVPDVI